MTDKSYKVFCIGLDGATFDLIRPWVAEGRLPNIGRMMQKGVWGELESVLQPVSAPAWTSFMTGKNPGKHGIFGFRKQKKNSYGELFVNRTLIRGLTLWNMLGKIGKKVIVMNVPITYPPEKVNGTIICGMDTPSTKSEFTHPPHIMQDIEQLTGGDYKIHLHLGGYLTNDKRREKALQDIKRLTDTRAKVADHLLRTNAWDFFMLKFDNPDQVQHYFWRYLDKAESKFKDAIYSIYRHLDTTVGRLMEHVDENTITIILSDHGAGPYKEKVFYVNEWLKREGLLFSGAKDKKRRKGIKSFKGQFVVDLLDWLYHFSSKIVSYKMRDRLGFVFPLLKTRIRSVIKFSAIDWRRTKAYLGGNLNTIHINLQGREPLGTVSPGEEYEKLRDRIIRNLKSITDPDDGKPVFEHIYRKEEVYHGHCMDEAPDLLLVPREFAYNLSKKFRGSENESLVAYKPSSKGVSGKHKMNGMFLIKGATVKKGAEVKEARPIDLFPNI